MVHVYWDDKSEGQAVYLWWIGHTYKEIARTMERTPTSVRRHLEIIDWGATPKVYGPHRAAKSRPKDAKEFEVPADVLADRSWRSGLWPRDLTAAFCGDPLPGYSALERRA